MSVNLRVLASVAKDVSKGFGIQKTLTGLGIKHFRHQGRPMVAIQQNPKTATEWAKLAKEGNSVVQFKDTATNKYVAVAVNGHVRLYQ